MHDGPCQIILVTPCVRPVGNSAHALAFVTVNRFINLAIELIGKR